jgi:hypothetical protein
MKERQHKKANCGMHLLKHFVIEREESVGIFHGLGKETVGIAMETKYKGCDTSLRVFYDTPAKEGREAWKEGRL